MIDLMKENEENRKRMALSIITGAITVIAVCALIGIVSLVDMPTPARILLIVFSIAVAVAGIAAAAMLDMKAGHFECPYCKELFVPSMRICKGLSHHYKALIDLSQMWKKGDVPPPYHKMTTPNSVDPPLRSLPSLKKDRPDGRSFRSITSSPGRRPRSPGGWVPCRWSRWSHRARPAAPCGSHAARRRSWAPASRCGGTW